MMKNIYDVALKLFVSDDETRPAMQKASEIGDMVYATNARVLMRLPKKMLGGKYKPVENYPDAKSVIDSGTNKVLSKHNISTDEIMIAVANAKDFYFHVRKEGCEVCEGKGTTFCYCCEQETGKCGMCDGSGLVGSNKEWKQIVCKESGVEYLGAYWELDNLYRVAMAATICKADEINVEHLNGSKSVFKFNGVEILVMQKMKTEL